MKYKWRLQLKYSPDQPRDEGGRWSTWGTGVGPSTARFSESNAGEFRAALDSNLDKRYSAFVTAYEPDEYQEMGAKTYLMDDGQTGFAIKPDGDIISVFSGNGKGRAALQAAIELGGTKLDCFDGFLPKFYSKFGFKEYERWAWDDQYAPDDWNYKKYNGPSVVLMRKE